MPQVTITVGTKMVQALVEELGVPQGQLADAAVEKLREWSIDRKILRLKEQQLDELAASVAQLRADMLEP